MSKIKKIIQFDHKIESFFKWPIVYLIIIIFLTGFAVVYDFIQADMNNSPFEWHLSLLFIIVLIVSIIYTAILLVFIRRIYMKEVINFAHYYGDENQNIMNEFIIPYTILDHDARVLWSNNRFKELFSQTKCIGKSIKVITPAISKELLMDENMQSEMELMIQNKPYKLVIEEMTIEENQEDTLHKKAVEEQQLYMVYFFDISSEYELSIKYTEEKPLVMLVYVDNYDEVINSIEDVRRPILIALIDRTINKFAKDYQAIYKKFEKDKYILILQRKQLEMIKEAKFDLLDNVRNISIGNEMDVTLSIGVGVDDISFSESNQYARAALDLALGRGGDQAVLKHNEKLSFYGGKTRDVEQNTRVKARVKSHAFRELLLECDRVIIMGHKLQDMDSLGAAMGVYACAKHFDKEAHIILQDITTSVKALYEMITNHENTPSDLFISNTEAFTYVTEDTLLVVVDVNKVNYTENPKMLEAVNKIVVFDHHRTSADNIKNATISYVETYASSTCEMVTEIVRYISDKVKLTPLEADALFAGISVDTKNFVAKAGVKTFEAAAFLRRSGADVVRVRKLFKNDMASYKAKATAVRDAQIFRENMAITVCPSDVNDPNLVGAQAADELLNIQGIKASFVLTDVNGVIYISARSLEEINVQLIMERIGGGGHLSVAGAQLYDYTIEAAITHLKNTIYDFYEKGDK